MVVVGIQSYYLAPQKIYRRFGREHSSSIIVGTFITGDEHMQE